MSDSAESSGNTVEPQVEEKVVAEQLEVSDEQPQDDEQVTECVEESEVKHQEEVIQEHKEEEMEQEQIREAQGKVIMEANQELEQPEECKHKLVTEEEDDKPLEESHNTMPLPVGNLSQGAIEDEEMPSMVTISSVSRIDESEINIRQEDDKRFAYAEENNSKTNPPKQEDDDSDSVCVIDDDSNEDDDENDGRGSSYDDEDESSSYDSEEPEQVHYEDANIYRRRMSSRKYKRMEDEDETEEDKEDEEEDKEDEEEDEDDDPESPRVIAMNDYSDPDGFDGGSDDLVHRHSNGFTRYHQERSNSLQDLSLINCEQPKFRHSVNPYSQKAIFERNQERRPALQKTKQYAHVESKVKKYIQDMDDQRKKCDEIRKTAREEARHKNQEMADIQICKKENVVLTCRTIKSYTEKTLKEAVECYDKGAEYLVPHSVGNGDAINQQQMDVDLTDTETYKNEENIDKMNGATFNENQNNFIPERKGIHRREDYIPKLLINGEDLTNPVCDLRSLTYEEYMKGSIDKDASEEVIHTESVSEEIQVIPEKCNNNETESDCGFQIKSVVSNYQSIETEYDDMHDRRTPTMMVNQSTETEYQEDPETNNLKLQLHQQNIQFDSLRDVYQRTMSENLSMKIELENLKKMLTYYQNQKTPVETRVIAVQTEAATVGLSLPIIDMEDNEQQINPRLATTSLMSSQWSDSTGSAAISMEPPPNVTTALNSDESTNQQTKTPKIRNPLSRAFLTSQRILQTLSNITYGKSKLDKLSRKRSRTPLRETVNEPGTSAQSENAEFADAGPPNTKKRKANDSSEIPSSAQTFKIHHSEKSKKTSDTSETPVVVDLDANDLNKNEASPEENESDSVFSLDDDVKVFVYPEVETGKENSFLIQAKEVTNNPKPGVRECGPYLLGNIEVYMTEMNGTINIWGKELSQASTSQNNEELDTSIKSKDVRSGFRWQSTPRIFNQGSMSTSKKSRVMPRFTHQHQHSCDMHNTVVDCDSCDTHNHRLSWPSCNRSAYENQNTCCPSTIRVEEAPCGCVHKEDRRSSCCGASKFDDGRRFSMPNVYHQSKSMCCHNNHNSYCRNSSQTDMQRHQTFVRRYSFSPNDEEEEESADEENEQHPPDSHSLDENSPHSYNSKLVPPGSSNKKAGDDCSEPPSCQDDNDPLIAQRLAPEVMEGQKRRLSGRKVRSLLIDLLKGCGDCRTANPINKTALHHNSSVYQPSTSTEPTACSPNQQLRSPRANEKCSSRRHKNDKTSEIEAQLEFFCVEIDKLRSRSDTLRNMLDKIRNEDIIN